VLGAPLEDYAARSVARLGILDLRLQQDPTPEDYQLASMVLGLALSIDPDDVDIARHRVEASWALADEETLIAESRRLVSLDPTQTVALLRVITSRIGQLQTAEERLAMTDRFLGPQGDRLDPSIRSRLALDAALLHRELGQEEMFVDRLNLALKLDGTNKEAAALAAALYAETVGDPMGRLEMAEHLLYADPLDPNTHLSISQLLCILGDWVGAVRFHDNFYRLVADDSTIPLDQFELQRFTMMYRTQGPGAVLNYFTTMLASMRHETAAKIKALQDANLPIGDLKSPTDTRLNFLYDRYRILAAKQHPDGAPLLPEALFDYARSVDELYTIMTDDRRRPRGMSVDEGV
ncbi:MAG: hypothetical protein KDA28_08015, partial [Phycisphaerales bacterium]|nr:hypothetical protein [Phycisphaerales bacterium]